MMSWSMGLAFACTDDGSDFLLASADIVKERTGSRASIATRATLDTVYDEALLGSFPVTILDITHEEGGIEPHRAYVHTFGTANTVAHGLSHGLLPRQE